MLGRRSGGRKDDSAMPEWRFGGHKGDPAMLQWRLGGRKGDPAWGGIRLGGHVIVERRPVLIALVHSGRCA
jgi:hypothetical protein